ncbi:hypothetical protein OLQ17_03475 [Campylobacter jejuni]|nr:hypothetical protein [Campylobacter jejuni]
MGKYGKTAVNDVNKVADDFLKGIEKPKAQEESKNKENKKVGPKPKEASKKRTLTVIIKITADEKKR